MIWGMFMIVTHGISSVHGKVVLGQVSFHHEYRRPHIKTKCSTYLQDWSLNKMRSLDWKQLVGKIFHGNTYH